MKDTRLMSLGLKNFKGVKELFINFDGKDTKIFGNNGVGKTRVFDSFVWLLFDKDSLGNSTQSFDIKTLDEDNNVIHGLDHEVEGVLKINDKKLKLRKVYYEKWTKKKGSADKKFTGHTTDYFINEVPVKKGEYDARISEIVNEDVFKLLTNPSYFNEELHWKERRDILFEVGEDATVEEVISAGEGLGDLSKILKDKTIEDHKKIVASKKEKINEELDKLPVRIDEVSNNLPDISDLDKKKIKAEIEGLKMRKKAKEKTLASIENGEEVAEKRKRLNEIESELLEIRNNHSSKYQNKIEQTEDKLENAREKYKDLKTKISDKNTSIDSHNTTIEDREEKMNKLRKKYGEKKAEWNKINAKEFEIEQEDKCPTCGQDIPAEDLEKTRDKALKSFNLEKVKELEKIQEELNDINKKGKRYKEEVKELIGKIQGLAYKIIDLEKEQSERKEEAEVIKMNIVGLKELSKEYQDSEEYKSKLKEKEELKNEIEKLEEGNVSVDKINDQIDKSQDKIDDLGDELDKFDRVEEGQARIEELSAKEKELSKQYSKLERESYLCEEFIRTKVGLVENKINSKFKFASFKMFDELVNGGVDETCETLYKGVPYGSGLNNAARVNVGLDVINTLQEHYGFKAPVFIDNSESVTEFVDVDSQMIKLIVSEKDKKLRVESD